MGFYSRKLLGAEKLVLSFCPNHAIKEQEAILVLSTTSNVPSYCTNQTRELQKNSKIRTLVFHSTWIPLMRRNCTASKASLHVLPPNFDEAPGIQRMIFGNGQSVVSRCTRPPRRRTETTSLRATTTSSKVVTPTIHQHFVDHLRLAKTHQPHGEVDT